jgi:hypothetical protein
MAGRVFPRGRFRLTVYDNVLGYGKTGKGAPQQGRLTAPTALFAEVFPLDDQQVDIRVWTGLAAGMRAKQDDTLRLDFSHNHLCHLSQEVV